MTTTMPPDRIAELTGYKRPADQIRTLHAAGYWLARLTPAPMQYFHGQIPAEPNTETTP